MTEIPMDRETAEEIKRHFSVVGESLRSEIRTVAEGLEGFQDSVSAEFKGVREELSEVKSMNDAKASLGAAPAYAALRVPLATNKFGTVR